MYAVLAFLCLLLAFAELYVFIQVIHVFGILATLALMVGISLAGAWLVKREGFGTVRRAQIRIAEGGLPGRELIDGLLILVAGFLLLTPGFITDAVGLALLVPPARRGVRNLVIRSLAKRVVGR